MSSTPPPRAPRRFACRRWARWWSGPSPTTAPRLAGRTPVHAPVDRLRIVEAFGYRRWSPPALASGAPTAEAAPPAPSDALASVALRFRRTAAGRAIARLLPSSARAALRSRLR